MSNTKDDYKVSVITWGTKHGDSKLTKQIDKQLHGGNVGHAAIRITFPADKRGDELIEKYCNNTKLLHFKKTKTEKSIVCKKDDKGNILFDDKGVAITEQIEKKSEYHNIYFSFWPSSVDKFYLHHYTTDKKSERKGTHVDWYHDDLDSTFVQQRNSKGLRSQRMITLGPAIIVKYPIMSGDESLKAYRDEVLQSKILSYEEHKEELELLKTKNKNKLLVNILNLYEKKWHLVNHYEDQIEFFNKKIKKLEKNNKLSEDIKKENINKLRLNIEKFETQLKKAKKEEKLIKEYFKELFNYNINSHISYGRDPDNVVDLPLLDSSNNLNTKGMVGLELEPMLARMKELVTDEQGFRLCDKNCSATTLSVVNSGITEENRSWMGKGLSRVTKHFKDGEAWLFKMCTPQSVYNSARQLEQNIVQHNRGENVVKMSVFKKILTNN